MPRPDQVDASEVVVLDWRETGPIEGGFLRAFEHFRESPFPWLLDSALHEHGLGRFSFMGSDPYMVIRVKGEVVEEHCRRAVRVGSQLGHHVVEGDPLTRFRTWLGDSRDLEGAPPVHFPFVGGAVGYLGYEFLSPAPEDPGSLLGDEIDFADATLLWVDRLLACDHETGQTYALALGFGVDSAQARTQARASLEALLEKVGPTAGKSVSADRARSQEEVPEVEVLGAAPPPGLRSDFEESGYTDQVLRIKEEIAAGNVYEANLTHRMTSPFVGDPWRLYQSLRRISPAPFACFIEVPDGVVVGSSPERFLKLSPNGDVESRPIKGTRRRGANVSDDRALEQELAASEKDRAENLMIVDLVRNDLGRVCETGSVQVPTLMQVERYASVFQMVSVVTGRLRDECDGLDLVEAAFPPGSMTGAPKLAAISLLEDLEPVRRGVYSGAVGYFDQRGGMDLSVVIRTILLQKERACLQVGGAVVADSDAALEYAETIDKVRALWAALNDVPVPKNDGQAR